MTTALVCGLGLVGRRAARQLVDCATFDRVMVTARRDKHVVRTAAALGPLASAATWPVSATDLAGVDVVVTALADDHDVRMARLAISTGTPIVSAADGVDAISGLRALDADAVAAGTPVIAACGFAPGYADILAAHARSLFDTVDEVRVARAGAAGPASLSAVRDQRKDVPALFRGGVWKESARLEEQVWFPEPIGAADCQVVRGGGEFLAEAFGSAVDLTTCWAETKPARWPTRNDDGLGAVRVEVWGSKDGHRDLVVYGAIDRVSSATGAVLGRVAELLVDSATRPVGGVHGVAAVFDAAELIRTLADRGLHAAVFEGAPIS